MIPFSADDILKLKIYCQKITYTPAPLDKQHCVREGASVWCTDWEIIEILKYLFHGRELYYGDPPPNRLKNNKLWSKDDIASKAESLLKVCENVDEIIQVLKFKRGENGAA